MVDMLATSLHKHAGILLERIRDPARHVRLSNHTFYGQRMKAQLTELNSILVGIMVQTYWHPLILSRVPAIRDW